MGLFDTARKWINWLESKFSPASDVDWPHIDALVHGPGASSVLGPKGGDGNSAVFACLMAIATAYPEPPLRVMRKRAGREYSIPEAPLQKLLDKPTPNGELNMEDLFFWIAWSKHTDGNAYLLKMRSGDVFRGNVVELWPVSPNMIKPITERDTDGRPKAWISYYRMQTGPNKFERVPVENIIHFRLGIDPQDRRKGLSPLKRLLREITTDDEASKFTDALLKNFAIPGLVVTPRGATVIDQNAAERLENKMVEKFAGSNRGKVAILSAESDISQFGFSPEQLQITALHRLPEERIAAVMGVPAIVAGLGAGLDRGTYSNARELREMYTETKLVPQWRQDAARLNTSLKPDFSSDRNVFVKFDITNVRALQEDMDKKYARLNLGVQGVTPWILRNEARAEVGFDPVPGWDEEDKDTAPAPIPPQLLGGNGNGNGEPPADNNVNGEGEKRRPFGKTPSRNGRSNGSAMLVDIRQFDTKLSRRNMIQARRRIRQQVSILAEQRIARWFEDLAEAVLEEARREEPAIAMLNGREWGVKQLTRQDWFGILSRVFGRQESVLEGIIQQAAISVVANSWELLNLELNEAIQFSTNDPLVQGILGQAGDRIRDIQKTTLDALRSVLADLYQDGAPIEAIAGEVRQLVEETYGGRAQAIARTEVGRSQNLATGGRYRRAGVEHVEVFDNGFENSHEFCRRVDGAVVTVEWMERNPLQHPNCVRSFGAVFAYDGPVWGEEQPWT